MASGLLMIMDDEQGGKGDIWSHWYTSWQKERQLVMVLA